MDIYISICPGFYNELLNVCVYSFDKVTGLSSFLACSRSSRRRILPAALSRFKVNVWGSLLLWTNLLGMAVITTTPTSRRYQCSNQMRKRASSTSSQKFLTCDFALDPSLYAWSKGSFLSLRFNGVRLGVNDVCSWQFSRFWDTVHTDYCGVSNFWVR